MSQWSFLRDAGPLNGASVATPESTVTRLTPTSGVDWRVRTVVQQNEHITDLQAWGFRNAGASNASPQVLKTLIGWIFHNKVTIDDAHAAEEQERVAELSHQVVQVEGDLSKAKHREKEIEQKIEREREKLEGKRTELAAVRAGDGSVVETHGLSDRLSFYIAAGTLTVLTVYLFLFYVSAIYNAFLFDAASAAEEGLRTGSELSVTIFNGQAFQKAWSSGLMTFAFLASAPSIVIGLGFLIHHFSQAGKRFHIAAIVGVTFLFDFLLAYEIVNQIHRIKLLTGETQLEWGMDVLLKSAEFYIILLAGFVVYIIWGLILQVLLEGVEKFRPARAAARTLRHAITSGEQGISRLEEESRLAKRDVVKLEGDLKVLEHKRSPRELRNNAFRRHLEELMQGWLTYIAQAFPEERLAKETEAQQVRTEVVTLLTAAVR
jgi:hypothetical protein